MYNLNEIVFSITRAVDGINPKFDFHSRMVAYTALTIFSKWENNGLKAEDVLLSALLHDIGVVRLKQKEVTSFLETIPKKYYDHEQAGAKIVQKYKYLSHLAESINFHHLSWSNAKSLDREVPVISHIINLSDRISVNFVINCSNYYDIKEGKKAVIDLIKNNRGTNFSPELADLFLDKIQNYEEFWLNLFFIRDLDFKTLVRTFFINPIYLDEVELKETVPFFGEIIDSHSSFTKCHSVFVAKVAYLIGDYLGLSEHEKNLLYISGYLHDLGKIFVPVEILEKRGPLDKEEREIISLHPFFTRKILNNISDFQEIADIASNHHERIDGSGYPRSLKGDEISISSKILMICDILASFLEKRPYRSALSLEETIEILMDSANNGKLDRGLVDKISKIKQDLRELINKISREYYCEVQYE
ncbi:MAG: HD domain-containing protein [Proteobacteria bacterium]|nr:HD domain-containing protein [Pseudomonadota bacterium]